MTRRIAIAIALVGTLVMPLASVRADDAPEDRGDADAAITTDDDVRSLQCPDRRTCAFFGVAAWEKGDTAAAARYFALEAAFGVAEDRRAVRERLFAAGEAERFVAARVATHVGVTRGSPVY